MRVNPERYRKPRRASVDTRSLHLKIRVVLTIPMTAAKARHLLARAAASGQVPPGIEVRWIDWAKGEEGRSRSGSIMGERLRKGLRDFYVAITEHATRFERVRE